VNERTADLVCVGLSAELSTEPGYAVSHALELSWPELFDGYPESSNHGLDVEINEERALEQERTVEISAAGSRDFSSANFDVISWSISRVETELS
jgi:hypothetical protein